MQWRLIITVVVLDLVIKNWEFEDAAAACARSDSLQGTQRPRNAPEWP
jgi:hypothetical protein